MKQPKVVISTLVAAGVFLIGAAVIMVLSANVDKLQPVVVESSVRSPVITDFPAPALKLTDLQGKSVSLSDYLGQVVLVNNWATWCPPCKVEMPELQAYYEAHAMDGFVLVGIEAGEPHDEVASFVQEYGLTFPVWLDAHSAALEAFQNWELPSSYVIDQAGQVVYSWIGAVNQQTLEQYVTPLLGR
jgi:peroxiredoxin